MLLITGGTSFNASKFLEDSNFDFLVPLNISKPKIPKKNINYFEDLESLFDNENFKNVEYIINFASSYNFDRSYRKLAQSSIFYALRILLKVNKKNLKLFINIGTYSQDAKKLNKSKTKYVKVKNFSDFLFTLFVSKRKYLNLKLGDTYGINDPRNKLNSILNKQVDNKNLEVYGSKDNLLYPVSIQEIKSCLSYVIDNSELFDNTYISNIAVYGKQITLGEYIDQYKNKKNLNFEVTFKDLDIHIEELNSVKTDYYFLIENY
tara:strand:+ start:2908 stop:3696 length:789 start_codon:yes stop_codon:yes gene_type:complete